MSPSRSPSRSPAADASTLVIRLDNAGDVLLAGPAVRAVAANSAAREAVAGRYCVKRFVADWDRVLAEAVA